MKATKKTKGVPFTQMTERQVTDSNAVTRTMYAKKMGDELRVYRIEGDVTDGEGIKESAQILAIEAGVERVTFKNWHP